MALMRSPACAHVTVAHPGSVGYMKASRSGVADTRFRTRSAK